MAKTSSEEFIRIWQTSSNLDDVCEQLGCNANVASSRAAAMRKRGVPLRKFDAHRKPNDWSKLAKLARSFLDND
jgi:hypothetical protein